MPTAAQLLQATYPQQLLEIKPVSTSGGITTFQVIYGGTPLPAVNETSGISFQVKPLIAGLQPVLTNTSAYSGLYPLGLPTISKLSDNKYQISASAASFTGVFPSLTSLPAPILEFSLPSSSVPIDLDVLEGDVGYAQAVEYSDSSAYPSYVDVTAAGATFVNSIGGTSDTVDYVSFTVSSGQVFDALWLQDYSGGAIGGTYALFTGSSFDAALNTEAQLLASPSVLAYGKIGTSVDPGVVGIGENALVDGLKSSVPITGLAPGEYTLKIENAGAASAYQLALQKLIAISGVPETFQGNEDQPLAPVLLPAKTDLNVALTWNAIGLPQGLSLTTTGGQASISGQLGENFNGSYPFTLKATTNDGTGNTRSYTRSIVVAALNDVPTLGVVVAGTIGEDGQAGTTTDGGLTGSLVGGDVDVETLTYGISGGTFAGGVSTKVGSYGTLTVNNSTGAYSYAKNAGAIEALDATEQATDTFDFSVSDGDGAVVTRGYTVTVSGADDAPTLGPVVVGTIAEVGQAGTTTDGGLTGSLVGGDVDVETLTYGISGGTVAGGVSTKVGVYGTLTVDSSTRAYSYAKNAGAIEALDATEQGTDTFDFSVSDGDGAVVTRGYTVTVSGADDAPTLGPVVVGTIAEVGQSETTTDGGLTGSLVGGDVDVETLTYGISGGTVSGGVSTKVGVYGTLSVNSSTGAYSYAKNAGSIEALDATEQGTDTFDFSVSDGDGAAVTRGYTVTVSGADDAPILTTVATIAGGVEDVFKEISYADLAGAANEVDVDSSNLSFRVQGVSSGTLQKWDAAANGGVGAWSAVVAGTTLISSGEKVQWKGAGDANGELNAFTVRAWDGVAASAADVQVKVNTAAVNDAPRLSPPQSFSILENKPFSTSFSVFNPDDSEPVFFALEGKDANAFSINQAGELSLRRNADFETQASYDVTIRATDQNPAALSSTTSLSLAVRDQPDQSLIITPASLAFIPTIDTSITLNAVYSQDLPLEGSNPPGSFSATVAYDGASLDFVPTALTQPGVTITNSDQGETGPSSLTLSSANPAQQATFKLDFNVTPLALGPFNFSWNLVGSSEYEKQTNSPVLISPDANAFIRQGALDLSPFGSPLRIDTQGQKVLLLDRPTVALPFTTPFTSLLATAQADELIISDSLVFNAGAGDDSIDLKPLSLLNGNFDVEGRLGAGRDSLLLPGSAPRNPGSRIQVNDFELGFDKLQLTNGQVVSRRSEVLALAADSMGALNQSSVQLRFAAIASDLDPGLKALISGQGSVIPSSIALDPGSQGKSLKVTLGSAAGQSGNGSGFAMAGQTPPSGYPWTLSADKRTATLSLPQTFSVSSDIPLLRAAVASLTATSSALAEGSLRVEWLDSANAVLASTTSALQITPLSPSSAQSVIDFAGTSPVKLEIQALPASSPVPLQIKGSSGGDSITLLSSSLDQRTDKAFGGFGDDLLIAGDGDRLVGGVGNDTMIARLGFGSTQLTGNSGNDLLIGGQNDALVAGAGDDILVVRGLGNRLSGGVGSDIFVLADAEFGKFSAAIAPNRILDFSSDDKIAFNVPGLQRSDISLVEAAGGVKVQLNTSWADRLGASDLAMIQGAKLATINSSQLLFNAVETRIDSTILSRVDVADQSS